MIDMFNKKINKNKNKNNFKLIAGDMKDLAFEKNISVFFMSYTLQFVRPLDRENLIKRFINV